MSQSNSHRDDYWAAVNDVAENVVAELIESDSEDKNQMAIQLTSEKCDQHDYVIHDELQIHTLMYSQNACAGLFDGTFDASQYGRNDDFPFADLAADALVADVSDRVRQMLDEH